MAIIVREGHNSRQFRVDNKGATLNWRGVAYGSANESAIFAAVFSSSELPASIAGLVPRSINGDHRGGGFWDVAVDFEVPEGVAIDGRGGVRPNSDPIKSPKSTDQLGSEFAFDASSGTVHITQSLYTAIMKAKAGKTAPNNRRAIGLTRDGKIEGCDRYSSKLEFTYTVRMEFITLDFVLSLRDLADKPVNHSKFLQFERGELLFLGATGQYRGSTSTDTPEDPDEEDTTPDPWAITYKFAVAKNQETVAISSDLVLAAADRDPANPEDADADPVTEKIWAKLGWEYLHVGYAEETVPGNPPRSLPIAQYAYIEQIYGTSNFEDILGFGDMEGVG